MKQNVTSNFVKRTGSSLLRCTLTLFVLVVVVSALSVSTRAQSKDRNKPTRLTSNAFSGAIAPETQGDNYHFSFLAGPGEAVITLTLSSTREQVINVNQVVFSLFDSDAREIGGGFVTASGGRTEQIVKRINVPRRQNVILRIIAQTVSSHGTYDLRIGGAVEMFPDALSESQRLLREASNNEIRKAAQTRDIDNPECLPKKGILRIKMKDGSIRRIDLSQAEEITITP